MYLDVLANFGGFALAYNPLMDEPFNYCLQWYLDIC